MKTRLSVMVIAGACLWPAALHWGTSCAAVADAAAPAPKPAASAKTEKPEKSDSAPATCQPVPARLVRYGWKLGYSYTYQVKANTQCYDSAEDLEGTVAYQVKSLDADGVADVECIESVTRSLRTGGHGGHHVQTSTVSAAPARIRIDKQGRLMADERRRNQPFVVGRLSRLAIEPVSTMDEKARTVTRELRIRLGWQKTEGPPAAWADGEGEPLLAREKTTYTIKDTEEKRRLARKTYDPATAPEEDGRVRLRAKGEGELTFDQETEVFASSTTTTESAFHDGGQLLREGTKVQSGLIRVTQEPSAARPQPGGAQVRQSGQGSF